MPRRGTAESGVRVTMWSHIDDPDDYSEGMTPVLATLGPLAMLHTMVIPFGEPMPLSPSQTQGWDSSLGWVHALWMFMGTEISSLQRVPASRAFARRAMRSIGQNEVSVVLLRRAAHQADNGEQREVNWSCCWIVQGHGRHLGGYDGPHHLAVLDAGRQHCLTCHSRATYVSPYIKGPDNLPLKTSRQLFKVSR